MNNKITPSQKIGLKSLVNFCPICENFLRIKKKKDGRIILVCICGYSEIIYTVDKRTKIIEKHYRCLLCAKKFGNSQSLRQHSKDSGHNLNVIIKKYEKQGFSLDEMIKVENSRKLPKGVKRNIILSYLVKKKVNFECQFCKLRSLLQSGDQVETHHIIPISKNGKDHSENLIVLCSQHHRDAHDGKISLYES